MTKDKSDMNQSVMASFKAAQAIEHTPVKSPRDWIQVCVCGHRGTDHGPDIGGSYQTTVIGGRRVGRQVELHGCCGEPLPAKIKKQNGNKRHRDTDEPFIEHPRIPGEMIPIAHRIATCPCMEWRPVLEISGGRPRLNMWRPVVDRKAKVKVRDRNPAHHALMRTIKAMATDLRNGRELAPLRDRDASEEEIDARVTELMEELVRWLPDGQRCWAKGCSRTDGVLPAYVDDDLSEMRCPEHRPS